MKELEGHLGSSVVEHLPLAHGVIPGSWDQVPHWAPRRKPASPSACVSAPLSVSLINKWIKSLEEKKKKGWKHLGGSVGWVVTPWLAEVMISGSWDQAPSAGPVLSGEFAWDSLFLVLCPTPRPCLHGAYILVMRNRNTWKMVICIMEKIQGN